jgi:hypothetical protein
VTEEIKIALTHPGKIGDLLYAWPTAQALCKKHGCKADFYTSEYCRPVMPLLAYQEEIDEVFVPPDYEITGYGQGVQPWRMPIHGVYSHLYHLGVNKWPDGGMIEFYGKVHNVTPEPFNFRCPTIDLGLSEAPIVVSVCRRKGVQLAQSVVNAFKSLLPVVQLGGAGEDLLDGVVNDRQFDFLESASILNTARVYAGGTGANSVLAIAFYHTPSVIAYTAGIDDRHLVPAPQVTYMKEPSFEDYLSEIKRKLGL